ncbi:hypothetical protein NG895_18675 [Aeoliella sp. ICT_H6.2]|uniref:PEP-CTERM protein-sorting domain-containing protein n=1 Tax=Aeoliella straminimaris TaxID=2954799 RepID=A0A9X2JK61_9BACT|nr:hypothetical protein [Aeoliella straminimaris]MCO6045929.1 hypothetical protein [Aeoliella straminimaris]
MRGLLATLLGVAMILNMTPPCPAGTIDGMSTSAPNNDDYAGTYSDSPNEFGRGLLALEVDSIFPVLDSGGVTEYQYDLAFLGSGGGQAAYHFELGFGTGDRFIRATSVVPALDFDAPLPSTPAVTSSVYNQIDVFPHLINFSDGELPGFVFSAMRVSFDVPDLPESVLQYYTDEQLANLPEGAKAFTLRHRAGLGRVPEPASYLMTVLGIAALVAFSHRAKIGRHNPSKRRRT